jgi:GT2 family glycosyltransferase
MTEGAPVTIVLIDNSERSDNTELFDQVLSKNSHVRCIKPATNLGYFGGAHFGLMQCKRSGQDFDWALVCNVDIRFPDRGFFAKLGAMKPSKEIGVVAPSICSSFTQHDQNPMMSERPSRARMRFYQFLHRSYYLLNLYEVLATAYHLVRSTLGSSFGWRKTGLARSSGKGPVQDTNPLEDVRIPIYAPHGACMIFSNEFFARGGSLEVPFFLYGEEIYVAETARALGLQVVYDPSLRLQHDEHQSTGLRRVLLSRQAATHLRETTEYLVDTYFS